jgi:uncharacterized protein (UPF0147 family)
MTAFELHIAIDQQLQEQGSYQHDRIFAEAKDLALNDAQDQIIEQIISDGIGLSKERLKHVNPLIEKNLVVSPIANYAALETRSAVGQLPAYVLFILNCRSEVVTSRTCSTLPSSTVSLPLYKTVLVFPDTAVGTAPFYNALTIVNSTAQSVYALPTEFTGRFQIASQKFEIMQDILDRINVPTGTRYVFWDGNNTLTFYSTTNDVNLTLNYTGIAAPIVATTTNLSYTTANRVANAADTTLSISYFPNKWVQPDHELYNKIHLNRFTGPKQYEPIYTVSQNNLIVYYAEDSIVTNMQIDYIRKPRKISLILNRTSELDPSVHNQVVNRAVEILKRNIQDQSLPGDVQFNNITNRK